MCGFIGCVHDQPKEFSNEDRDAFKERNHLLTHRGPDDEGYYFDEHVQFGFRRLSIIDLESGRQPLSYANERYWIIFNGEIYNYIELREELQEKGMEFATESDTEVILALYDHYKEKSVDKLRGMFAFLIWDREEKLLFGARDPFGIKPLYYYADPDKGCTFFASEKKAILHALENPALNGRSLQQYLTFQYVPEPYTMHEKIEKLLPGTYFMKRPGKPLEIFTYWKAEFRPALQPEEKWVEEIREAMFDSVKVHMRSDVPVGSFLSGGIDSTMIAAIAKEFHPRIQTFSVGFEREGYSEIDVARESAEKIGVENISYVITPEEYMKEFPKIMYYMDDPLADPACVPLYFVAREARKHVTVVLSGEGSDELFGGYNIYREPQSLAVFQKIPSPLKKALYFLSLLLPDGVKGKSFIQRGVTPLEERYVGNANIFSEKEKRKLLVHYDSGIDYKDITRPFYAEAKDYDPVEKMQYIDIHTWLRGDILLKADKMTMAHSLELRVPFLDKRVFEVASRIPASMKTADGTTKYILRKAAEGIVPDHVLNRKKLGFPVPIRHWLKEEMYDWAAGIIKESGTDEYLNKQAVLAMLEDHRKNKGDYGRKLWTILAFMVWHQVFVEKKYSFDRSDEAAKVYV